MLHGLAESDMIFGELQKSSAAAHRRRSMATTSALTDYEADLKSKDRIKQKDAIKRILASKVKNDWSWEWPREDEAPGTPVVNGSGEDLHENDWTERDEWISNPSDDDDEKNAAVSAATKGDNLRNKDPFRFDSPEGVGETLRKTIEDRKARRRRRLRDEMRINDGVKCFTHRRNAWTGARHVRRERRTKSTNGATPRTLSRAISRSSLIAHAPSLSNEEDWLDLVTEVPIAPPILPPETPMRKGINERAYATIYDKVILQSQTPFCPINLSIITKSCVEGWKRDGEWPPKGGEIGAVMASVSKMGLGPGDLGSGTGARERRESEGKDGVKNKGVIRRSLQKVMGAVRERAGSTSKGKDSDLVSKD